MYIEKTCSKGIYSQNTGNVRDCHSNQSFIHLCSDIFSKCAKSFDDVLVLFCFFGIELICLQCSCSPYSKFLTVNPDEGKEYCTLHSMSLEFSISSSVFPHQLEGTPWLQLTQIITLIQFPVSAKFRKVSIFTTFESQMDFWVKTRYDNRLRAKFGGKNGCFDT